MPENNVEAQLLGKWKFIKSELIQNGSTETEDLKSATCDYNYYDLKKGGEKNEVYHDEENNCNPDNWPGTWAYNTKTKEVTLVDSDDNYTIVTEVISVSSTDLKLKLKSEDGEDPPKEIELYIYLKKKSK